MKLSDIKPNPDNPRRIEDDRDAALDESLEKYGDLSGVVYNSNPECPALVSAHQRLRKFKKDKWKLIVTERFKEPQSKGTVAWGYVESPDGERYVYREVHWPKRKADEATIVANGQFGKWDADVLSRWDFEMDELRDMGVPEFMFGGSGEESENWQDVDYSQRNQEIDVNEFSDLMELKLKYGKDEFMDVQERLNVVCSKQNVETKEAALTELLMFYERHG